MLLYIKSKQMAVKYSSKKNNQIYFTEHRKLRVADLSTDDVAER